MAVQDTQLTEPSAYLQVLTVRVPKHTAWEPERDILFASSLFSIPGPLSLAITARRNRLDWQIIVRPEAVDRLVSNIYAAHRLADIEARPMKRAPIGFCQYQFHTAAPFAGPLMYADDFKKVDPLVGILSALTDLKKGEAVVYQISLKPATEELVKLGWSTITASDVKWWHYLTIDSAAEAATKKALGADEHAKYVPEIQRVAEDKLRSFLMQATVSVKVKASSMTRADHLVEGLFPALAPYEREGFNYLVPAQQDSFSPILSANEVAALWHLPNDKCVVPGIGWTPSVKSPLPLELIDRTEGAKIGRNSYQNQTQDVWLGYEDRVTHVNIIGKTRTGKSTLMHHMVHKDIASGKGVAVVDPHGALVDSILARSIPKRREKDVVLFDISDEEFPIGVNLLSGPDNLSDGMVAGQALAIIRKMFADNWSSSRMEDALHAALMAAAAIDGATIESIPKLFYNSSYRAHALQSVTDLTALDFWYDEYEPLSAAHQREFARPISHRLRKFYRNDAIRPVVCQSSSLDFKSVIDDRMIFLAKLGGIPEIDAETLGALLVSKFQMAAMSREAISSDEVSEYYLHVDEVQNFVTTSLAQMFSEAGKFGLRLVVANQYLRQLEGPTLEAVMGNVGTTVMFRVGQKDAATLAPYVSPVHTKEDLINLDRFQAIVKMQADGKTLPAFNIATLVPLAPYKDSQERIDRIKKQSRAKYARPREEVEAEIVRRFRDERSLAEEPTAGTGYLG